MLRNTTPFISPPLMETLMTRAITLTAALARASGQDAGNIQMRKAGRTRWNLADRNRAAKITNRLMLSVPFEQGGLYGLQFTHRMIEDLGVTVEQVIASGNTLRGHNGGPALEAA